jgi:hypothetical protein
MTEYMLTDTQELAFFKQQVVELEARIKRSILTSSVRNGSVAYA